MITTKKQKQICSSLNTNRIFSFTISIFLLISIFSCSDDSSFYPNDPFLICKAEDSFCEYEYHAPGFVTITKGSRRKHFILTENGLKNSKIKEGEPVAYNPVNKLVLVKAITDSAIEISAVNSENGRTVSSGIELPVFKFSQEEIPYGETEDFEYLSIPFLWSGCIQNDGTVVLLVNYKEPDPNELIHGRLARFLQKSYDFLFVYEKGNAKNVKKFAFPDRFTQKNGETDANSSLAEEPREIQCGKNGAIYIFSEKNWESGPDSDTHDIYGIFGRKYSSPLGWNFEKIELNPQNGAENIQNLGLIAYKEKIYYNYFSEKEKQIFTFSDDGESEKNVLLRRLELGEYEIPDEPVEKENGRFLFSETSDGKPLVFFVKTRKNAGEEERLELLNLN